MCLDPDQNAKTVFLINSDHLGDNPDLGAVLIKAFVNTLVKAEEKPAEMIFLNTGVNLTTKGSPVLDALEELSVSGVRLLSCGTCLEYFDKKNDLCVGRVTTMHDTTETLAGPPKVVTIS